MERRPALACDPSSLGLSARRRRRRQCCRSPHTVRGPPPCRRLQVSCGIQDPWSTLGVSRGASEQEVKRAHRQLVKQHHPDVKQKKGDALAHAQFLRIQVRCGCGMGRRLRWVVAIGVGAAAAMLATPAHPCTR